MKQEEINAYDIGRNPLKLYCKNCGAPMGFDIINQTYRCKSCRLTSGVQEVSKGIAKWRNLNKEGQKNLKSVDVPAVYHCMSCGAHILFKDGDASETCDFCRSRLVRAEFTDEEQIPDLIIPFFITEKEARERMLKWGHEHDKTPEGRSLVSSMGSFKGYYLPYKIVKGPVSAEVSRDGSARKYHCRGYLEGTAVNTSKQLNNLVLNEMEPFDWSEVKPFEYGYIAGQNVKLNNLSGEQIEKRVLEETAEAFLPEVERVMQTSGVDVKTSCEDLMELTVLLPVYFIKNGKLTAVMNGQTGRIAVSKDRKKRSNPWVIEPLLYTVVATLLLSIPYDFDPYSMGLFACVFGAIFFSIMGDGRHSLIRRITLRSEVSKASREKKELKIEEGKNILKNPYDNTPVFYDKNQRGEYVPVKIRFYTFGRTLSMIIKIIVIVLLPVIIAAAIRMSDISDTSEAFMDGFRPEYGAAWFVITGFIAILYFAKGMRKDIYNHPIIYDISSGGQRKIGTRASRKLSMFHVIGLAERSKNGRTAQSRAFKMPGLMEIFLMGFMLFVLAGSVAAILM